MARQRRGGFRPPELRGTLGTLIRTAVPAVRDVLERGAREGRARLDDALSGRRRTDSLAELGEIVLDLIRRGEIDVAELPEIQDIVAHLDEIDANAEPEPPPTRSVRKRFDDRAAVPPSAKKRAAPRDEDGTVSARTWSPPKSAGPGAARVWRPTAVDPHAADLPKPNPAKKGGISFDDDDLADYMHPDDVPPKDEES